MQTCFAVSGFLFTAVLSLLLGHANAKVSCKRQTRPDTIPCGVRGQLAPSIYNQSLAANPAAATSLAICRDLCVRRGLPDAAVGCSMFSFVESADVCYFYNTDDKRIIVQDAESPNIFYSRICYLCAQQACPATPDPAENLIDNGGFEASDTYIGPWSARIGDGAFVKTSAPPPKHPGVGSRNGLRATGDYVYRQDYRQCPGQVHRAEFDLYNVAQNSLPVLYFLDGEGGARSFSIPLSSPPSRQAKKIIGFYRPTTRQGTIAFTDRNSGTNGGTFSYDNVVIGPVDLSSAKTIGEEKVVNGGFEKAIKPWFVKAENSGRVPIGKFNLVSPGLEGTSQALRYYLKKAQIDLVMLLTPEVRNSTIRVGKLHRLRFRSDPPLTMILSFKDGTEIYGSTVEDQYFYTTPGMFPLTIDIEGIINEYPIHEIIFDELSIREIEDQG